MEDVLAWAGLLGAWLLVAGPLYQGALELLEQDLAVGDQLGTGLRVEPPPRPSSWWWLLPPVMIVLHRRRARRYRSEVLALLTPAQRARRSLFLHKATGWFIVASGAALLAVKETRETTEHYDCPAGVFAIILALATALCCGNTALFVLRQRRLHARC